jgi:hypothetical protein
MPQIDSNAAGRAFKQALETGDLERANMYISAGILQYLKPEQQKTAMSMVRDIENMQRQFPQKGIEFLQGQGLSPTQAVETGRERILGTIFGQQADEPQLQDAGKPVKADETAKQQLLGELGPLEYLKQTGVIKAVASPKGQFMDGVEVRPGETVASKIPLAERQTSRRLRELPTGGKPPTAGQQRPSEKERLLERRKGMDDVQLKAHFEFSYPDLEPEAYDRMVTLFRTMTIQGEVGAEEMLASAQAEWTRLTDENPPGRARTPRTPEEIRADVQAKRITLEQGKRELKAINFIPPG